MLTDTVSVDGFSFKLSNMSFGPWDAINDSVMDTLKPIAGMKWSGVDRPTVELNVKMSRNRSASGARDHTRAAHRQCFKYIETKVALKIRTVEKISFSEVLQKVRKDQKEQKDEDKSKRPANSRTSTKSTCHSRSYRRSNGAADGFPQPFRSKWRSSKVIRNPKVSQNPISNQLRATLLLVW